MASTGYPEPIDELRDETRNLHRALVGLMEELEAIGRYGQRADACSDQRVACPLAQEVSTGLVSN